MRSRLRPQIPPKRQCCGGEHAGTTAGNPTVRKEWHPGYYLTVDLTSNSTLDPTPNNEFDTINGKRRMAGRECTKLSAHRDESGRLRLERYRFGPELSRSPHGNKRLIIKIMDRVFGSTSYTGRLPAYLNSLGCIFSFPTQVENKFWRSDLQRPLHRLEQALAAHLDNNPKVEMILTEESSPGA